jgi:hypothetical protein
MSLWRRLEDAEWRRRLGAAGRRAAEQFAPAEMTRRYLEMYEALTEDR